jgi:hypothetical protein
MHLRSVVECLFKWQDDAKNHFKAKVFVFLCDRFLKKKNQCDFIDLLSMAVVLEFKLFIHILNQNQILFRLNFFWECLSRSVDWMPLKLSCLKSI